MRHLLLSAFFAVIGFSEDNGLSEEIIDNQLDGITGLRSIYSVTRYRYLRPSDVRDRAKSSGCFSLEHWYIHDGKVTLSRLSLFCPRQYLASDLTLIGSVRIGELRLSTNMTAEAMWTPVKHGDGTWSLRSVYGMLLSADSTGPLYTTDYEESSWTIFRIKEIDD